MLFWCEGCCLSLSEDVLYYPSQDLIVVLILAQCTEIYSMDAFISLKLLSSWLAENWGYSQLKQLEFQLQKHKQSFEK